MEDILKGLSSVMTENLYLAPLLAFLGGILTSFMPCCLSTVPLVIGVTGGMGDRNPRRSFRLSVVFALGMAITFTLLGTVAALAGNLLAGTGGWWYLLLGGLMVLMAFQTWEIFEIIPSTYLLGKSKKTGYIGALIAGILGGVFSSPCSTPVLVALLAIVAGRGSLLWGIVLFLPYALGHSIVPVIAGTSVSLLQKIATNQRYGRWTKWIKIIMGMLILLLGFYLIYLGTA